MRKSTSLNRQFEKFAEASDALREDLAGLGDSGGLKSLILINPRPGRTSVAELAFHSPK